MAPTPSKVRKKAAMVLSVDDYLESVSEQARITLKKIRKAIRSAMPKSEEGFSYGVPAFRHQGKPIAGYAASKGHCSYFPFSPAVLKAHAADLKGYDLSKGAIRFPLNKPLPAALVKKLVKTRVAEIEAGAIGHRKK